MPVTYSETGGATAAPPRAAIGPAWIVANLPTRDLERTAAFYARLCGLIEIERDDTAIFLARPDEEMPSLVVIDRVSPRVRWMGLGIPAGTYLGILHEDIGGALELANEFGLEIAEAAPFGNPEPFHAVIYDMDGRVVELSTPAAYLRAGRMAQRSETF